MAKFKHHEYSNHDLIGKNKVVYIATSKHLFYYSSHLVGYVLDQGFTPISPFGNFGYFVTDTVDREKVVVANNNLIRISDELWVFGPISDGVLFEIVYVKELGKPIKYFKITRKKDIQEVEEVKNKEDLEFESPDLKKAFFELN